MPNDATGGTVPMRALVSVPLALAIGVLAGAATSLLQTYAEQPWLGLVNSVSPWVTTAFVAGAIQPRAPLAALLGAAATVAQVLSYFATSLLRDFGVSDYYVLFWTACAVVAGPLFGWAGHVWRSGAPRRWLLAATTVLPAAWLAEGLVSYGGRLGYWDTATLFVVLGVVLVAVLGRRSGRWPAQALWLVLLVGAGAAGFASLELVL